MIPNVLSSTSWRVSAGTLDDVSNVSVVPRDVDVLVFCVDFPSSVVLTPEYLASMSIHIWMSIKEDVPA